jgi:hypothetical protein
MTAEELETRIEELIYDARESGMSDELIVSVLAASVEALADGVS